MLRKSDHRILTLMLAITAINFAILLVNLSFPSRAAVANMDYRALMEDADFKQAVQSIITACSVNVTLAKVRC